jgi:hypothetical protein
MSLRIEKVYGNRVYLHFDEIAVLWPGDERRTSDDHFTVITDVLLELESKHLSTIPRAEATETFPLNFGDLVWPYDMRAFVKEGCKQRDCRTVKYGDYRPTIAFPTQILDHSSFKKYAHCLLDQFGNDQLVPNMSMRLTLRRSGRSQPNIRTTSDYYRWINDNRTDFSKWSYIFAISCSKNYSRSTNERRRTPTRHLAIYANSRISQR